MKMDTRWLLNSFVYLVIMVATLLLFGGAGCAWSRSRGSTSTR